MKDLAKVRGAAEIQLSADLLNAQVGGAQKQSSFFRQNLLLHLIGCLLQFPAEQGI